MIVSEWWICRSRKKERKKEKEKLTSCSLHLDHTLAVRSLFFSKENILFSGSDDKTIVSYDLRVSDTTSVKSYSNHSGWVTGIALSPDGQYLVSW